MKIAICASMAFAKEIVALKNQLEVKGHEIVLPQDTEKYADGTLSLETNKESTENKIKDDLFRHYYKKIQECDAILVANYEKKNILHYIGGNTLIEMAFAHVLNKKLYLLNPVPNMSYTDEIHGMQPFVLNGNLDQL